MTIVNLSGYFQPPSSDGGKSLPSSAERAPSTVSNAAISKPAETSAVSATTNDTTVAKAQTQNAANKDVNDPIEDLQQFNQSIDRSLQFKVDDELGVTIVRVVDKETDELIRQFPPEELINLSRRLKELNDQGSGNISATDKSGLLLQEKV